MAAVTGPVRIFRAPPLQPLVPQPLPILKPMTPAAFSVQETRIVYGPKAVATTLVGAAGAGAPERDARGWAVAVPGGAPVAPGRGPDADLPVKRWRAIAVPADVTASTPASSTASTTGLRRRRGAPPATVPGQGWPVGALGIWNRFAAVTVGVSGASAPDTKAGFVAGRSTEPGWGRPVG